MLLPQHKLRIVGWNTALSKGIKQTNKVITTLIIVIWLYIPNRALASPMGFLNNNLFTGLDC
jgi:hypothetical protein